MDVNEMLSPVVQTWQAVRSSRVAKGLAYALAGLMLVSVGVLWSPQSDAVHKARDCVRAADHLHANAAGCLDLVRKIK